MKIDILTIFPDMFISPFGESIVKRACDQKLVEIAIHNLRDWSTDNYKTIDDRPYGGGAGMLMKVDVIDRAVSDLKSRSNLASKVILMDAKGEMYNENHAKQLSIAEHLILIVPHYEGVDHRVYEYIADEVYCIGPYVLTGGELPAMVVVDSVVRLIPNVINGLSLQEESYSEIITDQNNQTVSKVEYPQYTRPAEYKGWKVPDILVQGHHQKIQSWREEQRKEKLLH